MAKYSIEDTTLIGIADAIRAKDGSADPIHVPDIPSRIAAIQTGADVSGVTATEVDVVAGKIFVDASGAEKTGTLVVQTYYYGSGEPSADLGVDGDLYFKMEG